MLLNGRHVVHVQDSWLFVCPVRRGLGIGCSVSTRRSIDDRTLLVVRAGVADRFSNNGGIICRADDWKGHGAFRSEFFIAISIDSRSEDLISGNGYVGESVLLSRWHA